jgi:hypothetical protein
MSDIADDNWSERDDRNAENAPEGFPPGLPAQIETIGRMMMGAIKRSWNKSNPVYVTAGSGDNYFVTPEGQTVFLHLYEVIRVRFNRANTTNAPTFKFGDTNPRVIRKVEASGVVDLVPGDLVAGQDHSLWYDGTNYILSNPRTVDASSIVGLEGVIPIHDTISGMPAISVPADTDVIRVNGRNTPTDGDGGLYGTSNNGSPDKFTSLDGRTWYKIFKKPLVVAVSGQSNPANVRDYVWQPESNVYVWNATGTALGTAFAVADSTKISFPVSFANEIARQNPDRSVFVVTGARPGRAIVNWLPGAPDEDVYALLKTRVEAALSSLSASTIDRFVWWQGESDAAAPSAYETNFEAVVARLRGETWFPYNTNITIMGIVSAAINGSSIYRDMNLILQRCASKDPQQRMFFYTVGATIPIIDPTGATGDWFDTLHVNAVGTFKTGTAAAKKSLSGGGGYAGNGLWKDQETGNFGLGPSSLAGQLLDVRKDANSAAMIRAANLDTGASADTGYLALCANGSLDIRAYGTTQSGRAQIAWSGATSLDIKANNAAGGLRFFIGSTSENMRLSTTGLNLLSGVLFLNSQQVVKQAITGWDTPTGVTARTTFNPGTITLADLAAQVNALKYDLHAGTGGHGLIRN